MDLKEKELDIEKYINLVAKKHKIIVDKDDPIFAVVTIVQELIMEDHKKIELLLKEQALLIEGSTNKILVDAKDIANNVIETKATKIISALDQLHQKLTDAAVKNIEDAAAKNKIIVAKNNATQIKSNQIYFIIAGFSFVFALLGMCVGIFLTK